MPTLLLRTLVLALLALPVLFSTGPAVADDAGAAPVDSARAALERQLEAFVREIEGERPLDDPFLDGRVPDLIIVTSVDVMGEIDPCG